MADNGTNGARTNWRLEQLELRARTNEEATKLLAEFGTKHNEQILALDKDVAELKQAVKEVPVLKSEVASLLDGWRAVRNAFLAAAGGLVLFAAGLIWQATG